MGRAPAGRSRRYQTLRALCVVSVLSVAAIPIARAADPWLVQGLADAEFWNTDNDSYQLARNDDDAAGVGRFRLMAGWEPLPQLQLLSRAAFEGGKGSVLEESDSRVELALLRYSWGSRMRFMAQAGRIGMPVTAFSRRYLSSSNPLIGDPAGYVINYPYGAELNGWIGPLDFMAAAIDRPPSEGSYTPKPAAGYRPAAGVGMTPMVGLRVGATYTKGPYLGEEQPSGAIPSGSHANDFHQTTWGGQIQFSRGYFELNGEYLSNRYEVPGDTEAGRGASWYVEPKYTWTPRLFTAVRFEEVRRPYIEYASYGSYGHWENWDSRFTDIEAGVGYRLLSQMVVKVSYRVDEWRLDDDSGNARPRGRALALQFSYEFDVDSSGIRLY